VQLNSRGVSLILRAVLNNLRVSDPKRSTMLAWKRALEQAGVEFLDPTDDGKGEGVRFKSAKGKR